MPFAPSRAPRMRRSRGAGLGRDGRQQHVVLGKRLVQPRAVRRPAAVRPRERAGGEPAAERSDRAEPPFDSLGMGHCADLVMNALQVEHGELGRRRQTAMIELILVHLVAQLAQKRSRLLERRPVLWVELCERRRREGTRQRYAQPARALAVGDPPPAAV